MDIEIKFLFAAIITYPVLMLIVGRRKSVLKLSGLSAGVGIIFCYFAILGSAMAIEYRLDTKLQAFDLNGDGLFSGKEITPEQTIAMQRVISDAERNFVLIHGTSYSLIYGLLVFVFVSAVKFVQNKLLKPAPKSAPLN